MDAANKTIFQFFHWYYSTAGNLWNHARDEAQKLASLGVSHVWFPPAYKSAFGTEEPGYTVYDLYDLGEFDQKGSVRTRYGFKDEYIAAIRCMHDNSIQVLADIVLNHRHGGDEKEKVLARKVNPHNRKEFAGNEEEIETHTRFTFPGRQHKYSDFNWNQHCFTGISSDEGDIAMIQHQYTNGAWEDMLEDELGNYDYLMGNDVEFRNRAVREELKKWGRWYVETTGIDGFRLDALKHISPDFFPEWLDYLKQQFNRDFLCIGEYWQNNVMPLCQYLEVTGGRIQLFDVPLHHNFYQASLQREAYDIRWIFDNTLVKERPSCTITFVDNHDTQPLQSLESTVDYWFKPIAYAIILLREQGIPCVFYPALYEAKYIDHKNGQEIYVELNKVPGLEEMMRVRARMAYGVQRDYFDDPHIAGWTREGLGNDTTGCAVLISNKDGGEKKMSLGKSNGGKKFRNIFDYGRVVELDGEGEAIFDVPASGTSVWIPVSAQLL